MYCCCCLVIKSCPTLCDPMDCSPRLLCPWDSPGKNTGVGYHVLLQGIFLTQGWNQGLLQLLPWRANSFTTEPCGKNKEYIKVCVYIFFVVVQSLVMSDSLQPHGLQHARLPCPSPSPRICSNSRPLSR